MLSKVIRWGLPPEAKRWRRAEPSLIETFHEWLRTGEPKVNYYSAWFGGDNPHEASEYQFRVLGVVGRPPHKISYVSVVLPMDWQEKTERSFPDACLRMCDLLKPQHGYGGYGFAESSDLGVQDEGQPLIYAMTRRFLGVEVDRPTIHKFFVGQGIKGVNWLTVLNDHWLQAAGGLDKIKGSLSDACVFRPYDGGTMIQAGARPQLGDVNQKIWPAAYAQLARVLKPIQITDHGGFDNHGQNRFTDETSMDWLYRFDKDPDWAAAT